MVSVDNNNQEEENSDLDSGQDMMNKDVLVIAQEIRIAKSLACNDPKLREKQLRKLRKWLKIRSNSSIGFSDEDFLRLWKGLYYCMWMSDKPLVQETLADDLGRLIECLSGINTGISFFNAFLKTMSMEWFGIDQWRIDKFLMLIRRMLRSILIAIKKENWSEEAIIEFNSKIYTSVLESRIIGLEMHFMDIFLDELAKVSDGKIFGKSVAIFIKPFVKYMAKQHDTKILSHVRSRIFHQLLWQSERGRDYTEKYNAWRDMGFPTESINDVEKVDNDAEYDDDGDDDEDDDDIRETADLFTQQVYLDPRAGNVDVYMPILPVEVGPIIKDIEQVLYNIITNTKSRKVMNEVIAKYKIYNTGEFPLGVQVMRKIKLEPFIPLVKRKINELENLDNELFGTTRDIKKLNKKKRKKLLSSLDYTNATEDNLDKIINHGLNNSILAAKKKRKLSLSLDSWVEEEIIETPQKKVKMFKKKLKRPHKPSLMCRIDKKPLLKMEGSDNNMAVKRKSEWDKPLKNGEIEYFVKSPKIKIIAANNNLKKEKLVEKKILLPNPCASPVTKDTPRTPIKNVLLGKSVQKEAKLNVLTNTPVVSSAEKKVKIVLERNMAQKPNEYIRQVKNSPKCPYDSEKKPTKSLLKPNLMPSPINPFYKKKIGFQFNTSI